MNRFLHDLRYSARSFARSPGLALALIVTIALGIGSNVVVQGFARGLLREPAVPGIDQIVSVFGVGPRGDATPLTFEDYQSLQKLDAFEWIGAARVWQLDAVQVAAVTPELARLFGLDLEPGAAIAKHNGIDARAIDIEGVETRVKGTAPEWLEGVYRDRPVDLWIPFQPGSGRNIWALAKLRQGVSLPQAQAIASNTRILPYRGLTPTAAADLARVGRLLTLAGAAVFFIACANVMSFLLGRSTARSHEASLRVALGAARGQLIRERLADSTVISIFGGASGLVLALWTSRIVPALLFDKDAAQLVFAPDPSAIAWASAACAGIILLCGALPALAIPYDRPAAILRREGAGGSRTTRWFRAGAVVIQMTSCFVLLLGTAFLIDGFQSALRTTAGVRLGKPLIAIARASAIAGLDYFRRAEAAALAMPGATRAQWTATPPGTQPPSRSFRIEPRGLPTRKVALDVAWFNPALLARFDLPPIAGRLFAFEDQACRAAVVNQPAAAALFGESTPGRTVHDPAGATTHIVGVLAEHRATRPVIYYSDKPGAPVLQELFQAPVRSDLPRAELDVHVVSPGFFETMGIATLESQAAKDKCRTAAVNREASDLYFEGKALGAAVIDDRGQRTEITGVVQPATLVAFQRREGPAIYFPMEQDAPPVMTLILGMGQGAAPDLDDFHRRLDAVPGRGPSPIIVNTLARHLSRTAFAPLRIAAAIVGASAATALLLGVLGLYGSLSDAARRRRRELGVRIAFGAQRRHVILQVLKEGARLACAGIVTGVVAWLAIARIAPPWWSWLGASLVLATAVAIASILPARRALLTDPALIMREDS